MMTYGGKGARFVHLTHCAETDDIHAAVEEAHKRAYEGEERRRARYRVSRRVNLEHRENGSVQA